MGRARSDASLLLRPNSRPHARWAAHSRAPLETQWKKPAIRLHRRSPSLGSRCSSHAPFPPAAFPYLTNGNVVPYRKGLKSAKDMSKVDVVMPPATSGTVGTATNVNSDAETDKRSNGIDSVSGGGGGSNDSAEKEKEPQRYALENKDLRCNPMARCWPHPPSPA